jgi:diacylglycerol kinase
MQTKVRVLIIAAVISASGFANYLYNEAALRSGVLAAMMQVAALLTFPGQYLAMVLGAIVSGSSHGFRSDWLSFAVSFFLNVGFYWALIYALFLVTGRIRRSAGAQ